MQAVIEPIFHICYLSSVLFAGIIMVKKSKEDSYIRDYGIMAIVLGAGDAFHLIPRVIALVTTGLENHTVSLGFGKFVTSITMTIFYLILYSLYKRKYSVKVNLKLDFIMWLLALIRIILCFFPQNQWFVANSPLSWGIYRNIPFSAIGLVMIILYLGKGVKLKDSYGVKMSVAIILSFGFYIPVVLWSSTNYLIGMLMIPKTLSYLWIVFMGIGELRRKISL